MFRSVTATTLLLTALATSTALASPYCDAMTSEDTLPKSYKRLAPIYSSTQTGWIFTQDHLSTDYAMKSSAQRLMAAIVAEFAARDIRFAMLVAPPRPLVAGQPIVAATLDGAAFDFEAAASSFDQLMTELQETGAVIPNLLDVVRADPALAETYYFKRDTHWTPVGAAVSAHAFAHAAKQAWPDLFTATTTLDQPGADAELYSEKGSLAAIVEETCGTRPDPETSPYVAFSGGLERGLLDDLPDGTPRVALLGTSFSNRYEQDAYRVAAALEHALGAAVENMSLTGGGMIGGLETFILNGGLTNGSHDLILWELPYTQSFNSTSNLYQLLGALRLDAGAAEGGVAVQIGATEAFDIPLNGVNPTGVTFATGTDEVELLTLKVTYDDGKSETIKLQRSDRVPVDQRVDQLSVQFMPTGDRVITQLSAEFAPKPTGATASAVLWSK